jgi:outer membrane lipoprotein carrier protein
MTIALGFLLHLAVMLSTVSFLFLLAVSTNAADDANRIRRALEFRYQHAQTLKAVFYERYSDGNGGVVAESGTVYFSRPGRMRWEYESPEEKLFLVDGKNVWFYVPADHTASRAKLNESSDWRTPLFLLAGKADFSRFCRSIRIAEPVDILGGKPGESALEPGDTLLRCVPRVSAGAANDAIRDVLFETDPEAHLVRVVVREAGNVETEFRFGNWQENITISEVKFHFQAPPGVTIVDAEKLAGEAP